MATVPIVTEVTKAQLDALVAADGLNEGLQYKVTDKGWLLTATGTNKYIFLGSLPYLVYSAAITHSSETGITVNIFENTIGNVVWTVVNGIVYGDIPITFTREKIITLPYSYSPANDFQNGVFTGVDLSNQKVMILAVEDGVYSETLLNFTAIEIRIYP